jgi:hypothetical protein
MKKVLSRKPSASLVVAALALFVAASGTAIAASKLVSGDSLVKPHSLSGNRLRNHTLTGTQVNLSKLGKVPSARSADHASAATNASRLGGSPASAYVLGGGKALSARIVVPDTTTGSGQPILSLPGLGEVEIYGCNSGSIVFAAQYHNTSTQSEDLWLQETDESGGQSTTYQSVPAGGVVHLGGAYQKWHYSLLSLGSGTGKNARTATASVSAAWTLASKRCAFQAQATDQPGS